MIKSKLVFKVKRDYRGRVKKFKVRLVAKGFTQGEGLDYKEAFSPVAKGESFILALAIALRYRSRDSHLLSDKKRRTRTDIPLPPGVNCLRRLREVKPHGRRNIKSVVGALMYLAVHTRPDLSYTVNLLSRFNSRPTYGA